MGIPLIFIAVILFVAAYQNQLSYLATNVETDVKGFLPWLAAMLAIGAIGLIPKARPVSNSLFALVFLVLFLTNKGIFANIQSGQAFKPVSPPAAPAAPGATSQQPAAGPGVKQFGSAATTNSNVSTGNAVLSNVLPMVPFLGPTLGLLPKLGL